MLEEQYSWFEGEPTKDIKAKRFWKNQDEVSVFHEIELNAGEQYTLYPNTKHWFQAGGKGAFNYCLKAENIYADSQNNNFASQSGVLYNKSRDTLIRYPAGRTNTSYNVINGTKYISEMAFWDNRYLTTLTMPASIQRLDYRSINDLSENPILTSLIMPANSQSAIKDGAIKYCPNLSISYTG